ncbi:WhiB family transcriptional regulator [Streptomyces sp. NPDC001262]|uniref:WhiB family transcriptional regulator n=1 Tax=Streptomyces sp. NPDC001262 TaxID=3364552 RepID=UPI0036A4B27F
MGELTRARVRGWDPYWRQRGVCTHRQGDNLFFGHQPLRQEEAVRICRQCPVTTECLAYALDERITEGIFGGTTARWRGDLLARRPDVRSWRALLERARAEHRAVHAGRSRMPSSVGARAADPGEWRNRQTPRT